MTYSSIKQRSEGNIAYLALNQPQRRNALDDVMIRELTESLAAINRNSAIRVVVLTGEGNAFCAGMDLGYLSKFSQLGEHENLEDARNFLNVLQALHNLKKPVIAMVNGPALGGGCGLASACDFVMASKEHAKLGVPEVRIGFVPAVILVFLIRRMGEGSAQEFVLQGQILDADEACRKGLVTEVVAHERLEEKVAAFAAGLADSTSSTSISLTKELLGRLSEMPLPDALDFAVNLNALARKTDDFKKGIESFLQKKDLKW